VDPEDPANRVRNARGRLLSLLSTNAACRSQVNADVILEYRIDSDPSNVLSPEIALAIESLWHDPIIPSVMDRSSEFYLMDSAT
jgi:hypothetical protein